MELHYRVQEARSRPIKYNRPRYWPGDSFGAREGTHGRAGGNFRTPEHVRCRILALDPIDQP